MESKTIQKYKNKTQAQLMRKAVQVFNAYIRDRDSDGEYFTCASCRKTKRIKKGRGGSNFHAGHYYAAGQYSALRFDEVNVNGECVQCNYFFGDHLIGYRQSIIDRHGMDELQRIKNIALLNKRQPKKWHRLELIEIIEKYK